MRAFGRTFIPFILVVVGPLYSLSLTAKGDPLDRFEVLSVVADAKASQHAVVYRYHHADSSTTLLAVWIISGATPAIGSSERPSGTPVLAWTGPANELDLSWSVSSGKLTAIVDHLTYIRDDARFQDCYFEYEHATPLLCIHAKDVVAIQRGK